jgi:hypothetical protein
VSLVCRKALGCSLSLLHAAAPATERPPVPSDSGHVVPAAKTGR